MDQAHSGLFALHLRGAAHLTPYADPRHPARFTRVQAGATVVELGCRRGESLSRLAERCGVDGHAWGTTDDEACASQVQRLLDERGLQQATLLCCPLEAVPLPPACADLVVANHVLYTHSDPQAVWSEIHRLLRPGADFFVSDLFRVESCWACPDLPSVIPLRQALLERLAELGFEALRFFEESEPYDLGAIEVAAYTLAGRKG